MKNLKNKRGISLIVLVITIIVMIILATAIILSLNNSGIIGKANKAKNDSDTATLKEYVNTLKLDWEFMTAEEKTEAGSFSEYATSKIKEAGFKTEGEGAYEISDNGDIYLYPVIPEGFVASDVEGENTVAGGLVIYEGTEKVSTDTDAKTTRNQFVWVPVPDMSKFERTTTYDGTITKPDSIYTEPFIGLDGEPEYSLTNDPYGEWAEYTAMRASVEKYGGFYIGRYETGRVNETPAIVKGMNVYSGTSWTSAIDIARAFCSTNDTVTATLCYGVQWDSTLMFISKIDSKYLDVIDDIRTEEGMYLKLSGSYEKFKACNIYDMCGNITEWTMESFSAMYDKSYRNAILRGGSSYNNSYGTENNTVVYRNTYSIYGGNINSEGSPLSSGGIRVTLYLK